MIVSRFSFPGGVEDRQLSQPGCTMPVVKRAADASATQGLRGHSPPPAGFETGFLVGLLVAEGHFGGDGKKPHVVVRMHVHHLSLFNWLGERFPWGRLYGPYCYDGRHHYQWMLRGRGLREGLVPLLNRYLRQEFSARVFHRYQLMKERYGLPQGSRTPGTKPPWT